MVRGDEEGARALQPRGEPGHVVEAKRRVPELRWFCLIGCVAYGGAPFPIGTGTEWPVREGESGTLRGYANDLPSAYWNNWGSIRLTVKRLV